MSLGHPNQPVVRLFPILTPYAAPCEIMHFASPSIYTSPVQFWCAMFCPRRPSASRTQPTQAIILAFLRLPYHPKAAAHHSTTPIAHMPAVT
mmetsp:Transcript_114950/g.199942  ORF Transcript_114950/g.199942 Transcript_114950/m.199942 type:complete len:92 (+) Transcript_114950:698-973(+)